MTQKILFAVNPHYTLFNPESYTWIGSADFWTSLFNNLFDIAKTQNVDVEFMLIPSGHDFDAVSQEAAKHFLHLFNNDIVQMRLNNEMCLVKHHDDEEYFYYGLNDDEVISSEALFSHFVLTGKHCKSDAIIDLAEHYEISSAQCILLDSSTNVIHDAAKRGIAGIATAFHRAELSNENQVNASLQKITDLLYKQFIYAIHAAKTKAITDQSTSLDEQAPELQNNTEEANKENSNTCSNIDLSNNSKQPLTFRPVIKTGRYSPGGITRSEKTLSIRIVTKERKKNHSIKSSSRSSFL